MLDANPTEFTQSDDWDGLVYLLTDITYLEKKITTDGIRSLLTDFNLVRQIPSDHPSRQLLELLREAIVLDCVFLERRPDSLFQCLWNRCWWYDSPASKEHYLNQNKGKCINAWDESGPKLYLLMERWRSEKEKLVQEFNWLRSLRPPQRHLGSCIDAVFGEAHWYALSPDGMSIATSWSKGPCTGFHRIRIWEVATGRLVRELSGHNEMICGLVYSPDSLRLVSSSNEVKVWDVLTGELVQVFRGHLPQYWANGMLLQNAWAESLVGGADKDILRDASIPESEDGEIHLRTQGPWIGSPIFLQHGRLIVSWAHEAMQTIRIWAVDTGREVRRIECRDMWDLTYFIVTPDESRILTGESRVGCLIIDINTGTEIHRESGLASHPRSRPVAVSPDGLLYAFGKEEGNRVKLVQASEFKTLHILNGHEDKISELVFSPDSNLLATGAYDTITCIWDVKNGTLLHRLHGHRRPGFQHAEKKGRIRSISWTADGTMLATTADDGRLIVWEVSTGRQLHSLGAMESDLQGAQFFQNGRRLAGSDHEHVLLWNLDNIYDERELKSAIPSDEQVGPPRVSPDRCSLAFSLADFTIRVMDVESGLEKACFCGPTSAITSVRWFPDGRHVASASKDGTVRLWSIITGQEIKCMRGHEAGVSSWGHETGVTCLAVSTDGNFLASGGDDCTVRVWDPKSGTEICCLRGHEAEVHLVFFLKSGRLASFSGCDNTSRIWDIETGRQLRVCPGDFEYRGELRESPDGKWIVYVEEKNSGDDNSISTPVVIDTLTGENVASFEGHGKTGIEGIAFLPDGESVATSGFDGTVRVWSLKTGQEHLCLKGRDGKPGPLRFDDKKGFLIELPNPFDRPQETQMACVWDMRTSQCISRTTDPKEVLALVHPTEQFYFTNTREIAEVREVANGQLLASYPVLVGTPYEIDSRKGLLSLMPFRGSHIHLLKFETSLQGSLCGEEVEG